MTFQGFLLVAMAFVGACLFARAHYVVLEKRVKGLEDLLDARLKAMDKEG